MGVASSTNNNNNTTSFLPTTSAAAAVASGSGGTISTRTCTGVGNLIKLLPTGTVFLFNFLNLVATNGGRCKTLNKTLDAVLISLCVFSCCFASFTDSYTDAAGNTRYTIVTSTGLWPEPDSGVDVSKYRLRLGDFVHAFFTVVVFAVLSLLDSNTVRCFYQDFESGQQLLLQVLPPIIGVICGSVFMIFPNNRHGIGQPPRTTASSSGDTTTTT